MSTPLMTPQLIAKAEALQRSAVATAADRNPEGDELRCAQPWMFNVQVRSSEKTWPDSPVSIQLSLNSKVEYEFTEPMASVDGKLFPVEGKGPKVFEPAVTVTGWQEVSSRRVLSISLPDLDRQTIQLWIEKLPWITVRVEPFDASTILSGMKVSLTLPGQSDTADVTADNELSYPGLKPGKGKIVGIENDGGDIWEVVGFS